MSGSKNQMPNTHHYHLIGIGGIGMSAIAIALLKTGNSVSGSDIGRNKEIEKLQKLGATIFYDQQKENIKQISKKYYSEKIEIVISSAIKKNNEELNYCIENKFCIRHRSEILSEIMQNYTSIGVAGTHGKTSTTTFISTLMELCTNDISSIVGGIQPIYDSNSHIKDSKFIVAEIDESDGSTKIYKSDLGIITNIDFDHCDHFKNIDETIITFKKFASNSEKLLANYDCNVIKTNLKPEFYWSIEEIENVHYSLIAKELNKHFTLADYYEMGKHIDAIKIPIPGMHNLSNISAAIAACRIYGVSFEKIKKNINFLKLPKKRFEIRGNFHNREIIDDYAHHPNEIRETIKLAKLFINKSINKRRLVVIFQPHRYSRVEKFSKEFGNELAEADVIILTKIYSAGEKNINNINSKLILDKIIKKNKIILYLKDNNEIKKEFFNITQKGDLVLNLGAGNCHQLWSILNKNILQKK